jgi:alpha-ketoglutarate-dependent taurine dioxygenase
MTELHASPLRPDFGARITGMDPVVPLSPEVISRLRSLLDQYGVLVFPELNADARFQTYLSELLGTKDHVAPDSLQLYEDFKVSNFDEKSAAPFGRLLFHHEIMWVEDACKIASLYGKQVEQPSVPTLFVSAEDAWNTLPAELRAQVEGKTAVHCQDATRQRRQNTGDVLQIAFETEKSVTIPVGYQHPRNGKTVLYVCPLATHHIEGMEYEEGETLLEKLFDHLYADAKVYAHEWQQGDLVIWDNVTMQHARPNVTFKGAPRILRKTMTPMPTAEQSGLSEDTRPEFSVIDG